MTQRPRAPHRQRGAPSPAPGKPKAARRDRWPLWLAGILAATFVAYLPSLDNGFTAWDDNFYVTYNPLLRDPTFEAVLKTPVAGNLHPLTIWSLALNYQTSGLDPRAYHLTDVILHLANTALVFFFVRALSRGRRWTSIIAAALFGLHPMHVESVAWIAERKDVLYAFFYLAGLIAYLRYVDRRAAVWLWVALVAFVLSAAAKPAAVVFPITMVAIDWFRRRPFTTRTWLEKAPFFAVALIDGLLTLNVQQESGAITEHWNLLERAYFAAYGLLMYVVKLFVPVGLSAIYPYPSIVRGAIGPQYPAALAIAVVAVPAVVWLFRRNRVVLFGLAFYLINVALVLQVFTVGGAVMADRYTYISYIGLFVALAWWLDEPRGRLAAPIRVALAVVLGLLIPISAVATWKRCDVWQNAETLWNDTISKYPGRIADAYNNRGFYYYNEAKRYDAALADFNQAIALNPATAKFWANKGMTLGAMGRNDSALVALDRALALRPDWADTWNNRGAVKLQLGDAAGTIADCSRALELNPRHRDAHTNRAAAYKLLGRFEESVEDSRRAIELAPGDPGNYQHYGNVGYGLVRLGRYAEAIPALDEAIRLAPPGEPRRAAALINRSYARSAIGDRAGALHDATEAERMGAQLDPAYTRRLRAEGGAR